MARTRRYTRKTKGSRKRAPVARSHRRRRSRRGTKKGGFLASGLHFLRARDAAARAKKSAGHTATLAQHTIKKIGDSARHAMRGVRQAF